MLIVGDAMHSDHRSPRMSKSRAPGESGARPVDEEFQWLTQKALDIITFATLKPHAPHLCQTHRLVIPQSSNSLVKSDTLQADVLLGASAAARLLPFERLLFWEATPAALAASQTPLEALGATVRWPSLTLAVGRSPSPSH